MNKTIQLLEEKTAYLEKFLGLNSKWLNKLSQGDFGELESFRENRETILNIIKHIDALIEARSERIAPESVDEINKAKINGLLDRKDSLVKAILAQDLDIMQIIQSAKSMIITELQKVNKSKKTIRSYKSFNRKDTVDEKA